jgi:hypothetical protein
MFKKQHLTFFSSFTPRKSLPYDLSIVSAPVAVFCGELDRLIEPFAVKEQVKNCLFTHVEPSYEHLDLIWADDVASKIFPLILKTLEKFFS